MTDAGSPVADLYQDCAACGALRKGAAGVQVELLQACGPFFYRPVGFGWDCLATRHAARRAGVFSFCSRV